MLGREFNERIAAGEFDGLRKEKIRDEEMRRVGLENDWELSHIVPESKAHPSNKGKENHACNLMVLPWWENRKIRATVVTKGMLDYYHRGKPGCIILM